MHRLRIARYLCCESQTMFGYIFRYRTHFDIERSTLFATWNIPTLWFARGRFRCRTFDIERCMSPVCVQPCVLMTLRYRNVLFDVEARRLFSVVSVRYRTVLCSLPLCNLKHGLLIRGFVVVHHHWEGKSMLVYPWCIAGYSVHPCQWTFVHTMVAIVCPSNLFFVLHTKTHKRPSFWWSGENGREHNTIKFDSV